jgi:hypothetical protein
MKQPAQLTCTLELKPGEQFTLPQSLVEKIHPGRWIVTMWPCSDTIAAPPVRRHDAFLHGYAAADEGLYDDLSR